MVNKTVAIFGTFDGIHDGHRYFIGEAKKMGDQLVVIIARDEIILKMKGKNPINNEVERINFLLKVEDVDLVLLGDALNGTYNVLKEINPDVVCLGYDQMELYKDLENSIKKGVLKNIKLIYIDSHKGDTHHSSILNNPVKI